MALKKIALFIVLLVVGGVGAAEVGWPKLTNTAKPWSRWWWMGSGVDEAGLEANLESYSDAGFGGLEITCIYGVKGWEDKQIDFLSDKWVDMLEYASRKARSLGMQVDMPNGTGWPFGGPGVSEDDADMRVTVEKNKSDSGYSVSTKFSGRYVKRPAPGGAGYSINPFCKRAVDNYLSKFGERIDYKEKLIRAYFHDSFEYGGNWSDEFWEYFKKTRGYDLKGHLAEFCGDGDREMVARVKCDYRQSLAEMLLGNFTNNWTKWAHKNKALTRNQAHGSPGNLLDLYAAVDVPEIEIFGPSGFDIENLRTDKNFNNAKPDGLMLKFASSAASVAGKRLVSAESFTWLGEHFQVALSQVKPEFDQLICCGVNHVFYHGVTYSPKEEVWPGWRFYASVEFGPMSGFWGEVKYLNEYVARCQSVMQESKAGNDVLLYWPVFDIWHDNKGLSKQFTVHNIKSWLCNSDFYRVAKKLQEDGYCFDYVSDDLLKNCGLENYKVVVVPECRFMPVGTAERLVELAKNGKAIIFEKKMPEDVAGYFEFENRRVELKKVLEELKAQENVRVGEVGSILAGSDVKAEVISKCGLRFIRKRHKSGYYYFICNLERQNFDGWLEIATDMKSALIMDPLGGEIGKAKTDDGKVYVQLEGGQSLILKTFANDDVAGEKWEYYKYKMHEYFINGKWEVRFIEGRDECLPADYETDETGSWTMRDDAKEFSGTAVYKTTFELADIEMDEWVLDLGRVCESAKVVVNGEYVGTLWSLPFKVAIGDYLRKGKNTLKVEVRNLDANAIAKLDRDKVYWKKFYDTNIVDIQYKPFDASGWEAMESGLIGPVKIIPASLLEF